MAIGGLGARQDRPRLGRALGALVSGGLVLVGFYLLGSELVAYSAAGETRLSDDVQIGGVQVGGLSPSEAQARWEEVYLEQPLTLVFRGNELLFSPTQLGLTLNTESMLASARAQSTRERNFWLGFWSYLWGQAAAPVDVPLTASVQEGLLRATLEDIAARYNAQAGEGGFDLATLTFPSGAAGAQLDIEASLPLIEAALQNPDPRARRVELPSQGLSGSKADMDDLRGAILSYLESQGFLYDGYTFNEGASAASVFVLNLATGEEVSIQGDLAYSAVSTIKVGLMINFYRYLDTPPSPDYAFLLAAAIICSNNSAANTLIAAASDSLTDERQGLERASDTLLKAGAINSWITSPLFDSRPPENYPIIQRPESPTTPIISDKIRPDPFNTTTAEDMGTLMAGLYDCATAGGGLAAIFPNEITQGECVQMLEIMTGVKFSRFSELGAPPNTLISHKVGYDGYEIVGDVALVNSPAVPYVFVMYLWEDNPTLQSRPDAPTSMSISRWELIDEVARLVYNYFNPDQPLLERRAPLNPRGGAACVLPRTSAEVNLNDIDQNRYDSQGNPVPTACYDYPACRPFDNWGATP